MTTNVANFIPAKSVAITETNEYTTVNSRSIIDSYDVFNGTAGAIKYTVRIVPAGGTAGPSNTLIVQSIAANSTVRGILTGQILEPGDFISTIADVVGLTHRASGRKVTI